VLFRKQGMKPLFKHLGALPPSPRRLASPKGEDSLSSERVKKTHKLPKPQGFTAKSPRSRINLQSIVPQIVQPLRGTIFTLLFTVSQVPFQLPLLGKLSSGGKALAQTPTSCPVGTAPATLNWGQSNFQTANFNQNLSIGGINTNFQMTENPSGVINDESPSSLGPVPYGVADGPYGGINSRYLRWGIDVREPRVGGRATLTVTFAQPVTLISPLKFLDVDRDGARDGRRLFQDQITVTAVNGNAPVGVTLSNVGSGANNTISGNVAKGVRENAEPTENLGNVDIRPNGAVTQIQVVYQGGPDFTPPGQDQTIGLADFAICAPVPGAGQGSVGDTVYNDTNGDGRQQQGEAGIADRRLLLTGAGPDGNFGTGDDITRNSVTDANGRYLFNGLPLGRYRVRVENPPDGLNLTQTAPEPIEITANAPNFLDADFGYSNQQQGSIGDTVYNDTNGSQIQDPGEAGIVGRNLTLTVAGPDGVFGTTDDSTRTTTTDANGKYNFPNLPLGNYRVKVDNPPDGLSPTQAVTGTITLTSTSRSFLDADFGYTALQQGNIGDTVYTDTNGNGRQDPAEAGIAGRNLTLTGAGADNNFDTTNDNFTRTTATDANGKYNFPNLPLGRYRVKIDNPPEGLSASQTPPENITLGIGNLSFLDADFGFTSQPLGNIGDTVYSDTNGNSRQDPGEPGISGRNITLTGAGPDGQFGTGDDVTRGVSTDGSGKYSFPNLPLGNYRVRVDNPPENSNPTQAPPQSITLTGTNRSFLDADFGYNPQQGQLGTIGDFVFNDANGNSIQEPDERGIPNIEVTLRDSNGTPIATTRTDSNGRYGFPNRPPGNYRVTVNTAPSGFSPTLVPGTINLGRGQNVDTADFGFTQQPRGSIGDLVFSDNNGNNAPDPGEPGIPGLTLVARNEQGTVVGTTNTDSNGNYRFLNLPPGRYTVTVGNPPSGSTPTLTQPNPINLTAGQNIDTVDFGFRQPGNGSIGDTVFRDNNGDATQNNDEPGIPGIVVTLTLPDGTTTRTATTDANGRYTFPNLPPGTYRAEVINTRERPQFPLERATFTSGINPFVINLQPNQNVTNADFGFNMVGFSGNQPGSIGDTVFNDKNGNGTQDQGEPGVPNVTLTLTRPGPDGRLGTPDDTVETTTTNSNGIYGFGNLPPANYRVTLSPPFDLPQITTGGSQTNVTLSSGQNITNVDFGLRRPPGGTIGDTVFEDRNGNGRQDEGERGIPNATLTLKNPQGQIIASTITNNNGNYLFTGLPLGNFLTEVTRPNSEFSPTTQATLPANLTEGNPENLNIDFGFRRGAVGAAGPIELIKRITQVKGAVISTITGGLRGEVGPTPVQSGDEVEYTIYVRSSQELTQFRFCDVIPEGTTFVPGSLAVQQVQGNPNITTQFFSPMQPVPADSANVCPNNKPGQTRQANGSYMEGAVIVGIDRVPAGPGQISGQIVFRVRIK
jgi:large repetitive protein